MEQLRRWAVMATVLLLMANGCLTSEGGWTVNVDWEKVLRVSQTTTTLQVVVNPLLRREFAVSKQIYKSLQELNADYVRYVPWLPYPRLGVAELEPPSGEHLCLQLAGEDGNNETATLDCGESKIDKVEFASYGTPTGQCGSLEQGTCHAANSAETVTKLCVGKSSCTIPVNTQTFGDPCVNVTKKQFAVQVSCNPPINHTYWDFTVIDPMTLDFLNATQNHTVIINFSTIPAWMYKTPERVSYPDNPNDVDWSYNQGTEMVDPTARNIGDYYGRLVAWYTRGGFTDEYGYVHKSGYSYDIPYWECLNEVEYKHGNTPEKYTLMYDEMVKGIWRHADPNKKMKFVGMALVNNHAYNWYTYFLNKSNHEPGIPLDVISFHFYAHCHSRTDPVAYETFFSQADSFVDVTKNVQWIRDSLSPLTRLDVDEMGVILPGDNYPKAAMFPLIYWNAAGAMYAYLFGKLAAQGVEILGESQLVGYPQLEEFNLSPQFPSVAMVNWTNGYGNARYWVLKVLIDNFQPGDKIVETNVSNGSGEGQNPFCGDVLNLNPFSLQCLTPTATIDKILFASYGTPTGSCGNYKIGSCNAANSTEIVEKACLGKNMCEVSADTPTFGDPCFKTVKHLVVEAHCSSGGGEGSNMTGHSIYAQAFTDTDGKNRRILVVNKLHTQQNVDIPNATGSDVTMVEESRPIGPPIEFKMNNETLGLPPFAVAVVTLPASLLF